MNPVRIGSWSAFALASFAASAFPHDITCASVDSSGSQVADGGRQPAISADGNVVAFTSISSDLVAGDLNGFQDVFVHDRTSGVTERVSVDSFGVEGNADSSVGWAPVISADGRFVAFHSGASNLVAGDKNKRWDIFVRDRKAGTTEIVSVSSAGVASNGNSFYPGISPDGGFLSFQSEGTNLVSGDTNVVADVFVRDRTAGTTVRVSVDSSGNEANGLSYVIGSSISADGDVVAFGSQASNLVAGDGNSDEDIFVHVHSTGVTTRVSVDSAGNEGDLGSLYAAISDDGTRVVFTSRATNLVKGDLNGWPDVFVHDRTSGITARASVSSGGAESDGASADVNPSSISRDGLVVVFDSFGNNLVAFDNHGGSDAFRHELATGETTLISRSCSGNAGSAGSFGPSASGDGSQVAFFGAAANLAPSDTNGAEDVLVNDLTVPADLAFWTTYGAGHPGTLGVPSISLNTNPVFGDTITIDIGNSYGFATAGLLIFGYAAIDLPTSAHGHLLASPDAILAGAIGATGTSLIGAVPHDDALCGISIYLQALELDPGASHSISFTQGVEMHFGE